MSDPIEVQVPVSEVVYKATKAVTASITTTLAVVSLFATQISDGNLTWSEGGTLIGAVVGAATTVAAVWRVPNEVKRTQ